MPPCRYRLVVKGEIGPLYVSAFEGMEFATAGGVTTLVGPIEDQGQLLGLIQRAASLGLTIVSVAPVDGPGGG